MYYRNIVHMSKNLDEQNKRTHCVHMNKKLAGKKPGPLYTKYSQEKTGMIKEKIAIPTKDSRGINGERSGHFGHCQFFTLVDIDNGNIIDVNTLLNKPHNPGGCQSVVKLLQENNVSTVVAAGMGNGPLNKFTKTGIRVLFADKKRYPDVQSVIDGLQNKSIQPFEMHHLCKGSGNCHQQNGKQ